MAGICDNLRVVVLCGLYAGVWAYEYIFLLELLVWFCPLCYEACREITPSARYIRSSVMWWWDGVLWVVWFRRMWCRLCSYFDPVASHSVITTFN